jgi:hypothetical protein
MTTVAAAGRAANGGPDRILLLRFSRFMREASESPAFLNLDIFDDEWSDLKLGDDDLRELQSGAYRVGDLRFRKFGFMPPVTVANGSL